MKGNITLSKFLIWSKKAFFWTITAIVSLLVLLLIALQTPFAQNFIASQILNQINEKTRHSAKLSNIKIKWFDLIEIKGLEINDYQSEQMIYVENLLIDYELGRLVNEGDVNLDAVDLNHATLNLNKYKDTLNINLIEFVYDLTSMLGEKEPKARSPKLSIEKIAIDNFNFRYNNQLADSLPDGYFDYTHFGFEISKGDFSSFELHVDTIRAIINSLSGVDSQSGIAISDLKSDFELNRNSLGFEKLELNTPTSVIKDKIILRYDSYADFADFVNNIDLEIDLKGSKISKSDLERFVKIPGKEFTTQISARIKGNVSRISIKELFAKIGERSIINGNVEFMGLPKLQETFIEARVNYAIISPEDIELFLNHGNKYINQIGPMNVEGRFIGFLNDFVANANFKTNIGSIYSDLNFKFPDRWENASYVGKLTLHEMDLGKVMSSKDVGKINFKGKIKGKGITLQNAGFYLDANLSNSEFLGYRFGEIWTKGEFAKSYFDGILIVEDPNCDITLDGNIDLGGQHEVVKFRSEINQLNLFEMGLSSLPINLSGEVVSNIHDLDIDSISGNVGVKNLNVGWEDRILILDSIGMYTNLEDNKRVIEFELPDIFASLRGDFSIPQILSDFQVLSKDLTNYFINKSDNGLIERDSTSRYKVDFNLEFDDLSKYIDLIVNDDLYVSKGGSIEGTYYQRKNATLSFYAEVDSVNYNGFGFKENNMDLHLSKDMDSSGIMASFLINSNRQQWEDKPPTRDLNLEAIWNDNKIGFNMHIAQPDNKSYADLNGELKFEGAAKIFHFSPSRLIAFDERWFFNPKNKIVFTPEAVDIEKLDLFRNEQSISLKGRYSDSLNTDLNLIISSFNLNTLSALVPIVLDGVMDAEVNVSRQEASNPIIMLGDLYVDKMKIDGYEIGDIGGVTQWDQQIKGLNVDFSVKRANVNTIQMWGNYFPYREGGDQLDLTAIIKNAHLRILEPFFKGLFSSFKGSASGEIKIAGTPTLPIVNGKSTITNGGLKFDYLGTSYTFDGDLAFDNSSINFNSFDIYDRDLNRAVLYGNLVYNGLNDFNIDLDVRFKDFNLLNTSQGDNSLYYGTANGTGLISVSGTITDILIKAKATTEKGTKIFIPLTESSEISQKDYISFVNLSDSGRTVNIEELVKKNISGVKLDLEVEVTPDAYAELIFDIKTGDIIRGRGRGNLKMILDTSGDFELFGDLAIIEGAYNFTLPAIGINKEFNVVPGSTISWYGDPYAGTLNMDATYRQLASFSDYNGGEEIGGISQKFPILVVLDLNGNMLTPEIGFEIKLEDSQASLSTQEQQALLKINNDEQQLKKQVFSLLILRRFSPSDSYLGGSSFNDIEGSLSEFLSNQLSYFISQMDENLEVDVDLTSLDQEALNTFQLRLSYTFMDGRLRVSGAGAVPQNNNQTLNSNDYFGDWSVRYMLTPDGHFRVKAFSQTEQIATGLQRETGISLQYIESFNQLKEVISKSRENAVSLKGNPQDVNPVIELK